MSSAKTLCQNLTRLFETQPYISPHLFSFRFYYIKKKLVWMSSTFNHKLSTVMQQQSNKTQLHFMPFPYLYWYTLIDK